MNLTREQRTAAIAELPKHETRAHGALEVRADDNGTVTVFGYPIVWDEPYHYGSATNSASDAYFTEYCRAGMATKTLREGDQRLLIEHGGLAIARVSAGNLRLVEDDHGVRFEADLDTSDPDVQRLLPKLRSGTVSGMSFGFRVIRQNIIEAPDGTVQRDLEEVAIDEVSIVSFPAYQATEVGLRALDPAALAEIVEEARAGKALSAENAKLVKAAHQALAALLGQANASDVEDEAASTDEDTEDRSEDGTETAAVNGDVELEAAEATRSADVFAQYKWQLAVAQLRNR